MTRVVWPRQRAAASLPGHLARCWSRVISPSSLQRAIIVSKKEITDPGRDDSFEFDLVRYVIEAEVEIGKRLKYLQTAVVNMKRRLYIASPPLLQELLRT